MSDNKFGEPWSCQPSIKRISTSNRHAIEGEPEYRQRACTCVNALAGIDDVQGFVDAVRELMENPTVPDEDKPAILWGKINKIRAMMEGKHD